MPADRRRNAKLIWYGVLFLLLLALPQLVGQRLSEVVGTVGLYVLLGLGLNIVVGFAGLLDLGYVAFYAVGAYTTAVLTSPGSPAFSPELPFWGALPFVIIAAALIGLMVGTPVLRLRGDYLAIVTLGFGEIARTVFLSAWAQPVVGGAQGILSIPPPLPFERDPQSIYYPILLFCIIAAVAATSLASSRVGRAWNAMREDESVAEATGVNTTVYKLLAFMLGAAFGCLSGALFAAKIGVVFPQSFDILVSINALALIILGGMGNIAGRRGRRHRAGRPAGAASRVRRVPAPHLRRRAGGDDAAASGRASSPAASARRSCMSGRAMRISTRRRRERRRAARW